MINLAMHNGRIKIIKKLELTNGDHMIMSKDKQTMSGDKIKHQINGEQIIN